MVLFAYLRALCGQAACGLACWATIVPCWAVFARLGWPHAACLGRALCAWAASAVISPLPGRWSRARLGHRLPRWAGRLPPRLRAPAAGLPRCWA